MGGGQRSTLGSEKSFLSCSKLHGARLRLSYTRYSNLSLLDQVSVHTHRAPPGHGHGHGVVGLDEIWLRLF